MRVPGLVFFPPHARVVRRSGESGHFGACGSRSAICLHVALGLQPQNGERLLLLLSSRPIVARAATPVVGRELLGPARRGSVHHGFHRGNFTKQAVHVPRKPRREPAWLGSGRAVALYRQLRAALVRGGSLLACSSCGLDGDCGRRIRECRTFGADAGAANGGARRSAPGTGPVDSRTREVLRSGPPKLKRRSGRSPSRVARCAFSLDTIAGDDRPFHGCGGFGSRAPRHFTSGGSIS